MKEKKIFVIGPNKCGTISLYIFFKKNNLKPIHWDNGNLALKIISNISANLKPLNVFYYSWSLYLTSFIKR